MRALILGIGILLLGCTSGPITLISLTVETDPPADIYFDGLYVGTGPEVTFQVFSNLIPNYLEMRDIMTGEVITRMILHQIPALEKIVLEYDFGDAREKRIETLIQILRDEGRI